MTTSTALTRALGLFMAVAFWGLSTPSGWLAMLCLGILLHGAAVALRAIAC